MRKITTLLFVLCVAVSMAQAKSQASTNKTTTKPLNVGHRTVTYKRATTDNEKALFTAISDRNVSKAQELLKNGVNPNMYDDDGNTPLVKAARYPNNETMLKGLVNAGADVNLRNNDGETPLDYALGTRYVGGNAEAVKTLLDMGADFNMEVARKTALDRSVDNEKGLNELVQSASASTIDAFTKELEAQRALTAYLKSIGAPSADDNNSVALVKAVKKGNVKKVEKLLNKGAKVNSRENGLTAFELAVDTNQFEIADLLLAYGADIEVQNSNGYSMLADLATTYARDDEQQKRLLAKMNYLIDNGANVNARQAVARCYATVKVNEAVCALLVTRGADVNVSTYNLYDEKKHSALFYATANGLVEAQKLLLAYGATPLTQKDQQALIVYKVAKELYEEKEDEKYNKISAERQAKQEAEKQQKGNGIGTALLKGLGNTGLAATGVLVDQRTDTNIGSTISSAMSVPTDTGTSTNKDGTCQWNDLKLSANACNKCVNTKPRTQAACTACCNSIGQVGLYSSKYYATDPAAGTKSAGYFQPGCYCNYSNGKSYKF